MINFYDDEFGFTLEVLEKKTTGFPMNVYLDGFGKFREIENNIPVIYIQNNYKNDITDTGLITITISKDPKFLEEPSYIFQEDRDFILEWVKEYYNILMDHWNKVNSVGVYTLYRMIKNNILDQQISIINESQKLFEMSNFSKVETNLPMNIWVDKKGNYRILKHNLPRLKFQPNDLSNMYDFKCWISISIDEKNPTILINNPHYQLKDKDINALKSWIKDNYDLLNDLYEGNIDEDEFLTNIKKENKND